MSYIAIGNDFIIIINGNYNCFGLYLSTSKGLDKEVKNNTPSILIQ